MDKPLKPIPKFASEAEERAFWERHDSADYVDWSKAERARRTVSVADKSMAEREAS